MVETEYRGLAGLKFGVRADQPGELMKIFTLLRAGRAG